MRLDQKLCERDELLMNLDRQLDEVARQQELERQQEETAY